MKNLDPNNSSYQQQKVPAGQSGKLALKRDSLQPFTEAAALEGGNQTVSENPGMAIYLLQDVYDASGKAPYRRWLADGLGRYVDQKKFPTILHELGLQLPNVEWQNKPGTRKILTEKDLATVNTYRQKRDCLVVQVTSRSNNCTNT